MVRMMKINVPCVFIQVHDQYPVLNAAFTPVGASLFISSMTDSQRSNTGRAVLATAG